jgi:hypothetical protein
LFRPACTFAQDRVSWTATGNHHALKEPAMLCRRLLTWVAVSAFVSLLPAAEPDLPLVYEDGFEKGAEHWQPMDPTGWKVKETNGGHVYSQFEKSSRYRPPHRSPFNIAVLKDLRVGDFVLQAKVLSTHPDYGHRDASLVFGYQDPAHFYYVHLGKKTDNQSNQIMIVNGAPRVKITKQTTPGTNWDEQWHEVKIVRRVAAGTIEIYFDDTTKPVMVAEDKTFAWGLVGIGSFDDTSDWDDIRLNGVRVEKPKAADRE